MFNYIFLFKVNSVKNQFAPPVRAARSFVTNRLFLFKFSFMAVPPVRADGLHHG